MNRTKKSRKVVRTDKKRMEWLSVPGRWVELWPEDSIKSWFEARKQVHHYIRGVYTITKGNTLQEAIDKAMEQTEEIEDSK